MGTFDPWMVAEINQEEILDLERINVEGERLGVSLSQVKCKGWTLSELSGPLSRLNAILSLLQPLDRYRTSSPIGSAIGRPLSRPISHPNTGGSPQPPCSKPLWRAQPRDSGAIVSKTPLKQARNKNAIDAAILNRILDRD